MISVHAITAKKDYRFWEMMAVEALELAPPVSADPKNLLNEKGWTLHEYDYAQNRAVFLDVGPDADIIQVPFAYSAQFRLAKRLAFISFEDFLKLAKQIKPDHRIIHFFNIGHCGSTLLHHVFNESGEVWDISEPKFTRDIAMFRTALPQSKQLELAHAGLAFLSLFPRADERKVLAIKHFSQCTKIYDIWQAAPLGAKNIYLYRDAIGWGNSNFGFWQRIDMPVPMPFEMRKSVWPISTANEPEVYLDGLVEYNKPGLEFGELMGGAWALHTQEFLTAREAGMECLALRYNELTKDREGVLAKVFAHCGLNPATIAKGLKAFEHDAHAGELTSHDKPVQKFGEATVARIREILGSPKLALDPDIVL
jgi:hypothetical protein